LLFDFVNIANRRGAKRQDLIAAPQRARQTITGMAAGGKLAGRDRFGARR
jgi:hypothetical protein